MTPYMTSVLSGRLVAAYNRDEHWEIRVYQSDTPAIDEPYDVHTAAKDVSCGAAILAADQEYPAMEGTNSGHSRARQ